MITSLELRNFVVYRGQRVTLPSKGLILISGPNGSGKSTIASAIGCAFSLRSFKEYLNSKDLKFRDLIARDSRNARVTLTISNLPYAKKIRPFSSQSNEFSLQRDLKLSGETIKTKGLQEGDINSISQLKEITNFNLNSKFVYVSQGKLADLIPRHRVHSINYFDEITQIVGIEEKQKLSEAFTQLNNARNIYDNFNRMSFIPAEKEVSELEKKFKIFKRVYLDNENLIINRLLMQGIERRGLIEEIEYLQINLQEIEKKLENLQNEFKEQNKRSLQLNTDSEIVKDKLSYLQKEEEQIESEIESSTSEMSLMAGAIGSQKTRLELTKEEHERIFKLIFELKEEFNQLIQIEKSPDKIKELIEQQRLLKKKIKEEEEKFQNSINQLQIEIERLESYRNENSRILGGIRSDLKDLEKHYRSIIGNRIDPKDLLRLFDHDAQELDSYIRKNKLDIKGPIGLLLNVSEPTYGDAVEVSLGYKFLNSFVTENNSIIKIIDQYILDNRLANTSVYLIDPNEPKPKPKSSLDPSGIIGRIGDLVKPSNELVEKALAFVSGFNWILCEDLDTAHDITLKQREISITQGERGFCLIKIPLGKNSILTNGMKARMRFLSGKSAKNLSDQIEELRKQERLAQMENIHLKEKIRNLSEQKETLYSKDHPMIALKEKLSRITAQIQDVDFEFNRIENEINQLEIKEKMTTKAVKIIENTIHEAERREGELENEISRLKKKRQKIKNETKSLQEKNHSLSIEKTTIEYQIETLESDIFNIQQDIDEMTSQIEGRKNDLSVCNKTLEKHEKYRKEKKKKLSTTLEHTKKQNPLSPWIEIYTDTIENLDRVSFPFPTESILDTADPDRLYKEIIRIKADYESLARNPEMNNVVDRFDDANRTLNLLRDEKRTYQLQINQREAVYKENYRLWFEVVNDSLVKIRDRYQQLIKSVKGNGYIKISGWTGDPKIDSPRVDFFASFSSRPPRSVMSHTHSGGEATLMLITFLLSLHAIAPQPFYILDEPDAHLDPINRSRMFKMVRNAAKNSQYFIISPQGKKIDEPLADCHYFIFKDKEGFSSIQKVE